MVRLNPSLLADLKNLSVPKYARDALQPGLVHIGVGAFHRAHQAVYTEQVLNQGDLRWGTIGASLRTTHTRDALAPQRYLYTVCARDGDRFELQVPGGLINIVTDAGALISAIADPRVQVVTLTITEKGYADTDSASSALGVLALALGRRMKTRAPLTIISCDNLSGNGDLLSEQVRALCRAPGLTSWVDEQVSFPNSMVDRIVPRTTAADIEQLQSVAGYADAAPVLCETFSQWVIQNDFRGHRPAWEMGGAMLVDDVVPYEQAKLRLLNASHSLLAYLGLLKGHAHVHEAVADPDLRAFVLQTLRDEIRPGIEAPAGMDLDAYTASILRRFANDAVPYRTAQVASDGSHKLAQRIHPSLKAVWATGAAAPGLELGLCAWLQTLRGSAEDGSPIAYDDPGAAPVRKLLRKHSEPAAAIRAIAQETALWSDFPPQALLRMEQAFVRLARGGVAASLAPLLSR